MRQFISDQLTVDSVVDTTVHCSALQMLPNRLP